LWRCRQATWAAGRDTLARETVRIVTHIPTPGGCWPDEMTALTDAFYDDLACTAEAVVAADLLDPGDLAILTQTWRSHFTNPVRTSLFGRLTGGLRLPHRR
jgi:hypothetical protein